MSNCLVDTYVVVPNANVTKHIVDIAVETDEDTLRHSLKNPNKVVLKFPEGVPVPEEIDQFPQHTYEEWVVIRRGPDWTPPDESN